jgi:hypothetical protein
MFGAFYLCSLLYAVCSEIQDEGTLQAAICHNVREHKHVLRNTQQAKSSNSATVIYLLVLT